MTTFNNLPLELLPGIIQNVVQPRNLASFCLVNKTFCKFTQPFLYHAISVFPWHHKEKIIRLFRTLSSSPELAKHVRKLEIRNFPKGLNELHLQDLIDSCIGGLANTVNLQSCIWTRDGSLRTSILLAIVKHPLLQELEINGHHYMNYDHNVLPQFTGVRRIKLIMPTPPVTEVLQTWLRSLIQPLQSLSIVCKSYSIITDERLERLAEDLSGLEELHLAGCRRVTHEGLIKVLHHNKNGIRKLSIENISPLLDLSALDRQCQKTQLLRRLTSLTITISYTFFSSTWKKDIPSLVSSTPLEYFQLYCTTMLGEDLKAARLDDFVTALVSSHGSRLKRFSIHRLPISLKALDDVCTGFTKLEQLFIVVEQEDLEYIGKALSKATKLQAVHVNFMTMRVEETDFSYVSSEDALQIVNQCSPTLTQIGCASRVWQVTRAVTQVGDDTKLIAELAVYDRPEVPDQFRVMQI